MVKVNLKVFTRHPNTNNYEAEHPCGACCFDKFRCGVGLRDAVKGNALVHNCQGAEFFTADTDAAKVIMARLILGVPTDG